MIVVPKLDLVVAFYGGNYADRPARIPQQEWMPKFVLPAVGGTSGTEPKARSPGMRLALSLLHVPYTWSP